MPTLIEKNRIQFLNRELLAQEREKNAKINALSFIMEYFFESFVPRTKRGDPPKIATKMGDKIKILVAATGSGKGSIGLEIYMRHFEATNKNIAVLQPTIATTVSIPNELLRNIPEYAQHFKMGENIGYQTGSLVRKPVKGVIFMTTGVIAQMLKVMSDENFMRKFAFILLDEAHVRRIELDLVFFMLKRLVERNLRNRDCPFVVAMSATMPANRYADYFGVDRKHVIYVPGQKYPKKINYAKKDNTDYYKWASDTVIKIHTTEDDEPEHGDILIFVYGMKAMKAIEELLNKANETFENKIKLARIESEGFSVGTDEYFSVLTPLKDMIVKIGENEYTPTRRVILGTPAVETGLTLETLKYCIETGYVRTVEYNPVYGLTVNTPKPVTQSMAIQRYGRVGRRFPGVVYLGYTEKSFNTMEENQKPDIYTQDLSKFILQIIINDVYEGKWDGSLTENIDHLAVGKYDVRKIDLLDYPAVDSIMNAQEKLYVLGFIDNEFKPTKMGLASSYFRISNENLRMIFEGYVIGANVGDLISIASILETDITMLINTNKKKGTLYKQQIVFGKSDMTTESLYKRLYISCDVIEALLAFYAIQKKFAEVENNPDSVATLMKWFEDNGLLFGGWAKMISTRDALIQTFVSQIGLNPLYNGLGLPEFEYNLTSLFRQNLDIAISEVSKLKKCMYAGYMLQTATWNEKKFKYVGDFNGLDLSLMTKTISPLPVHSAFKQPRPQKILTFGNVLRLPPRSEDGKYELFTSVVSSLDGHVLCDDTFVVS